MLETVLSHLIFHDILHSVILLLGLLCVWELVFQYGNCPVLDVACTNPYWKHNPRYRNTKKCKFHLFDVISKTENNQSYSSLVEISFSFHVMLASLKSALMDAFNASGVFSCPFSCEISCAEET